MDIKCVRSDKIYSKMMQAPAEKREDIYRYELMGPFEAKWSCYNIPLKAKQPNGYDVIMASRMLGFLAPEQMRPDQHQTIDLLSDEQLWQKCQQAIERSMQCFIDAGIDLPVQNYLYTLVLANPESPYTIMNEGYSGDGGIPGYIFGSLLPNEYTLARIPVALAHECNHNIRFQFEKWRNDITLAEMMVNEGLAENFAVSLFGEDMVGPWVSKTEVDVLHKKIKPVIKQGLHVTGLDGITSYLYGDEMAKLQGYEAVGLPYCAGYACGYHMVKYYLNKTGKNVVEATLLPADQILKEIEDFWDE
jgi:uncharacterized protein YjaZ